MPEDEKRALVGTQVPLVWHHVARCFRSQHSCDDAAPEDPQAYMNPECRRAWERGKALREQRIDAIMGVFPKAAAPTCRTFDDHGDSICERPARFIVWGHLYEKKDKGPKCGYHLPPGANFPTPFGTPAIYEIPGGSHG